MEEKRTRRYILSFVILVVLLLVLLVWNIHSGSLQMSIGEVLRTLLYRTGENAAVIWDIRLPRILAVILLGGALSVSGFLLQTFFANPIASPFILGISSGSRLVVSLIMVGALTHGLIIGSALMIAAAFVGAMLCMGFVLLISQKVRKMSLLIICGVMIGDICSAVTDFVVTFADDSNIVNLHNWSMGSFSGISWENITIMAPVVLIALLLTFLLSKPIGAYQMGEVYAQNMGVNIRTFRVYLILLSSLLSACVAAFAGPISFVGIAVPHLVKSLFRTAKPLLMIPGCFLGSVLPVLRSGRAYSVCAYRVGHQFCDGGFRRAGRNLHHGPPQNPNRLRWETLWNIKSIPNT